MLLSGCIHGPRRWNFCVVWILSHAGHGQEVGQQSTPAASHQTRHDSHGRRHNSGNASPWLGHVVCCIGYRSILLRILEAEWCQGCNYCTSDESTLYGIYNCNVLQFDEFRLKMGNALPRISKDEPANSRTDFESLTDLMKYLAAWNKE